MSFHGGSFPPAAMARLAAEGRVRAIQKPENTGGTMISDLKLFPGQMDRAHGKEFLGIAGDQYLNKDSAASGNSIAAQRICRSIRLGKRNDSTGGIGYEERAAEPKKPLARHTPCQIGSPVFFARPWDK